MSQLKPHAPKNFTIGISAALVLLGLFGGEISPYFAANGSYLLVGGYVLLLLGVYIKGL